MADDDDRAAALAREICQEATFIEVKAKADNVVELLAEPAPLPQLGSASVMTIYRRLAAEREMNARLRACLRAVLLGSDL